jgi:flavin-dependent dehydrogenase
MSESPIRKRIVILGGGTAGWITASAMMKSWADKGFDITLIESPVIGTVGVGEGSTPRLKLFFDSIGVEESEWMPRCNATYKNGISFAGWSTRPGFDRYFHPFASQLDQHTSKAFFFNTHARRRGIDVHAHPDRFFLAAKLAENRQGPRPGESFPFIVEYGYHFDANLVGDFLKERAKGLGVKHIEAKIVDVRQSGNGHITSLLSDAGETIEGDFFVDCSGFRGALIQKTLGVPFRSFAENLFNDAAVVLPTGVQDKIASQTVSTAMKNGWAWEIPLTHRIGNGYVYSSSFCSPDDAEMELRTHLGLLDKDIEARHLKMKVGRVENHWHKNCLAIGLSQGFIEPLEATALNLVCNTVYDFIETVDAEGFDGRGRESFNDRANERFEAIRDYIVAHYILNSREDTDYWKQNGANKHVPETLQQILQIWKSGKSLGQEMERLQIRSSYTVTSWHCLLAGYGFYPVTRSMSTTPSAGDKIDMAEVDEFIRRCSLNFQAHNDALRFQ